MSDDRGGSAFAAWPGRWSPCWCGWFPDKQCRCRQRGRGRSRSRGRRARAL